MKNLFCPSNPLEPRVAIISAEKRSNQDAKKMNSTASSHSNHTSTECEVVIFLGGRLDRTATFAHMMLVLVIVMNVITCPITTVLNALVMFAVKTKPRLKTKSNVALGCLASTDCIIGVIGQPLFSTEIAVHVILQGEACSTYCTIIKLAKEILRILALAFLFHLALMNAT